MAHELLLLVVELLLAGGHDVDDAALPVAPRAPAALNVPDRRRIRVVAQNQVNLHHFLRIQWSTHSCSHPGKSHASVSLENTTR